MNSGESGQAVRPLSRTLVEGLRLFCLWGLLLVNWTCSSGSGTDTPDSAAAGPSVYASCDGEPGGCSIATRFGGVSGDGCLCTIYCEADSDCPAPASGTASPTCQPYGDVIVNGHKADCRLPCDASTVCPDKMFCSPSGCIAVLGKWHHPHRGGLQSVEARRQDCRV